MAIKENIQLGYISLYRSIQESWIYPNHRKYTEFEAWIDLLMMVNYKDNKALIDKQLVVCERGSTITSELNLGYRWLWGRTSVRSFLQLLEKDGMIMKKSTSKYTHITICNYDTYQISQTTNKQRANNEQTTSEQQPNNERTQLNKDNKDNKGNKDNNSLIAERSKILYDEINAFIESHPNKYPKTLYRAFYDYFSAPLQKPTKNNLILKDEMKTWSLSGRLSTWYGRDKEKYDNDLYNEKMDLKSRSQTRPPLPPETKEEAAANAKIYFGKEAK